MTTASGLSLVASVPVLLAGVLLLACAPSATGASGAGDEPAAPTLRRPPATGPLRPHPGNPRYFADATGRAILLTGSHTWNNLQDLGPEDPPAPFDFPGYLDLLDRNHHNFIRLWRWELLSWDTGANREKQPRQLRCSPHPWRRTGPGPALDGRPKFDLTQFDPAYFERLRSRVLAARDRGIYVAIMLFEGWGMQFVADAWKAHPFHPANSLQGVEVDRNGDGKALELHQLGMPAVTALQEAYVRQVVDTVQDLDNVLFEISNENHPGSTAWQYHFIQRIQDIERSRPRQHPVGMTFQYRGGRNTTLFESPADWVSPNPDATGGFNYRDNPPPADGRKILVNDTDHLWGIGGNAAWVWKSFTRGLHPIFMDPHDHRVLSREPDSQWKDVRAAMGVALRLAESLDLASLVPQPDLASSMFCLAGPREIVVFAPGSGEVRVQLSERPGRHGTRWVHPVTGEIREGRGVEGGAARTLASPWHGDAVLHLTRRDDR